MSLRVFSRISDMILSHSRSSSESGSVNKNPLFLIIGPTSWTHYYIIIRNQGHRDTSVLCTTCLWRFFLTNTRPRQPPFLYRRRRQLNNKRKVWSLDIKTVVNNRSLPSQELFHHRNSDKRNRYPYSFLGYSTYVKRQWQMTAIYTGQMYFKYRWHRHQNLMSSQLQPLVSAPGHALLFQLEFL